MRIGSQEWSNFIYEEARNFEVLLGPGQLDQFAAHAGELVKWTRTINITAITDPRKIAIHHFLDSLAAARFIPPGAALLDIGSGGGFPGIPLKVALPGLSATLIDASRKKVNFIKHVIRTLQLDPIEARHIRAQDLAVLPDYAGRFDIVISRALSSLEAFITMAIPLLAEGGSLIALKGEVDKTEVAHLPGRLLEKLDHHKSGGGRFDVSLKNYFLPALTSSRSIVIVKHTP